MTKGIGTTIYLRADTVATNVFSTVCATSVSGGGIEGSAETVEPCLDDTIVLEYPGDPKYAQLEITYKKSGSTSGISYTIEALQTNVPPTVITVGIKIPYATPIYDTRQCYVVSQNDDPKQRNQDMTVTLVLAPQEGHNYSTTEPST